MTTSMHRGSEPDISTFDNFDPPRPLPRFPKPSSVAAHLTEPAAPELGEPMPRRFPDTGLPKFMVALVLVILAIATLSGLVGAFVHHSAPPHRATTTPPLTTLPTHHHKGP